MWPFRKRYSLKESGLLNNFTDYHSHILPGVDDGVQTMEESLEILNYYEQLGIKTVWLTPHIMEDIPNTTEHLRERFEELKCAYHGKINLQLAAEYMLDNLFRERLEDNDLLPLGENGDILLVETSYFNPPMGLYETLENIKKRGYYPVLAHPERYVYMKKKDYIQLKSSGIRFQNNLFSLVNAYGMEVRKKAEWLLKEKIVDVWGTDTHHFQIFSKSISDKSLKPITANRIQPMNLNLILKCKTPL